MGPIVDTSFVIDLLGVGLLKSMLIVGAAWLLTAGMLRAASASVRHWIWTMAFASLLVLPLMASWLPTWEAPLVREPLERVWALTQPKPVEAPIPQVVTVGEAIEPVEAGEVQGAPGDEATALAPEPAAGRAPLIPRSMTPTLILAFWVLGGVLLLLRPIAGMVQVQRWTRQALRDPQADAPPQAVVQSAGLNRGVTVRHSAHIAVPLTWGLWRPVILLPTEAANWKPERLRAVLLHELAHIRRWDYLVHLLAQAARAVYWFNPLVWFAVRRMQQEQEQACDDVVLHAGTPPDEYATHLLEIARSLRRPSPLTSGWVGMARHTVLKGRIQAILAAQTDRQPLTWSAGVGAALAMTLLVLPVASLQGLVSPEAEQVQRLLVTLRTGDVQARQQAALRLGQLGDRRAIDPLLDALADRAEPVSVSAGLALQQFDDPRVRQALAGLPFTPEPGTAGTEPPSGDGSVYVWLEAEQGALTAPMASFEAAQASGGAFVEVPDGPGNDSGGDGTVRLAFEVPVAGRFAFWGRALGPSTNDNSFFVSVDDGPEVVWDTPEEDVSTDRWVWDRVSDRNWESDAAPAPLMLDLDAGRHTLHIRNREDGTRLDRLLVTNDLGYEPAGHGSVGQPLHRAHIWLEAEDGLLSEPLKVVDDPGSAGGQFIEVEAGHNSRKAPPDAGRASYPFTVLEEGTYLLWGRIIAPDGGGDSFWVRIDGDRWVPWNGITQTDAWTWVPVYHQEEVQQAMHFNLSAGPHTLEIAYREDDTRLDRLLITNDVSFTPSGHGPAAKPVEVIFRSRR